MMDRRPAENESPGQRGGTIDLKDLPVGGTFLRILGVNYVHLTTEDGGDLYITEHGLPFREHLRLENWYEETWFKAHRERLQGTSAVYKVPTRPVTGSIRKSLDLVVKWSRVGQDVPLDTFTLNKTINAEFNTPFEEFSLVEELRQGSFGPRNLRILMQKPMAIYAPPERMQLWQTGRSRDKLLSRVARHPGIEVDILRSYILLYAWVRGLNAVDTFARLPWGEQRQEEERQRLMVEVNAELEQKGFLVADNKPTHMILRTNRDGVRKRRNGKLLYAMVDYELLARTPEYEEEVKRSGRSRYLQLQKQRFEPGPEVVCPEGLFHQHVMGVDYIVGRSESTGGTLWVVGKHPDLFGYFLPEKWRFKQVNLSQRRQTYYVQSKDRIHLVWEVSRMGEPVVESPENRAQYASIARYGYNCPFEEFAYALELRRRGVPATYPRAIYRTGHQLQVPEESVDESRFERFSELNALDGKPLLLSDRDYILIWGYWRGLEDADAPDETGYWTPIDVTQAVAKGLIPATQLPEILDRQRKRLAEAGFEDLTLAGTHVLLSYIPQGPFKQTADGYFELRQCNFEMIRPLNPA